MWRHQCRALNGRRSAGNRGLVFFELAERFTG
jgi:hypothetical protein